MRRRGGGRSVTAMCSASTRRPVRDPVRHPVVRRIAAAAANLPLPPGHSIGIVVIVVLDRVHRVGIPGPRWAHRAAGAAAIVAGGAANAWALAERRRRSGGAFRLDRPQSLVTTGPYALSRHPMYVGWWLIHLGIGVFRGSAWLAATLPLATLAEHRGVLGEERTLDRDFGAEYAAYSARVPRYVRWPVRARGSRRLRG
ncbi:isoprenylcysteine carboxylmethyltransferase family protein [Agromyces badenianii]|uniref:Isoprenylcysteine carboxylmethyltransferase family protein n=2 Tax=Agromyces badenianii TaxID=2080742 RepID=A0A2S0WSV8_9MICO|nr:isoprenylcysteine carboxylmethyltransferase family protein [Agromyces badenianii]